MEFSYDLSETPSATALAVGCALVAAVLDHRRGLIPNSLTYPCLLAGLTLAAFSGGLIGLTMSLAGMVAGGLVFLVAFAMGNCGGGDVKLMAALGAVLGLWPAIDVTLAALMTGGVLALFSMSRRIDFRRVLRIVGLFAMLLPMDVKNAASVLVPRERHTVRFGVAAAGGLFWCLLLPDLSPLSFLR
ncbi:A24 family peptidase [Mesorhizobium sp. KR1-2]|uniref:A24 family peptidase n=1 Tax=Mesorhizobium sp. KR1-2 TaxID=3156609 RepID=UPI0032B41798